MSEEILKAIVKRKMRDSHLRDFEVKNLKSQIGSLAKEKGFDKFSKADLLELAKHVIIEKLEEMVEEIKVARF